MTAPTTMTTIARATGRAVSWLLLLACLASLAGAVWWVQNGKDDPAATIAGFRPYVVATGSMAPGFDVHSLVITRATPFEEVEEGDVVSFRAAAMGGAATLHRVVDVRTDQAGTAVALVVKGDNNPHPDGAPVTREEYLGTVAFHTNFTSYVVQQYQAQHGFVRVVVIPVAVVVLVWLGSGALMSSQRSRLGRTAVALTVTVCVLASVAGSCALYLDHKEEHVTSTLGGVAETYERQPAATTLTLQNTSVNGTIDIPRIDVHYPVIEYVAASSLNVAITHFHGPGLNQPGNVVLAGHRAWGNLYFTRIDLLEPGDVVRLTDSTRTTVTYRVTGHRVVGPRDASVLARPKDGKRHLTLISCTYDLRNRYVVTAVAEDDLAATDPHRATPAAAGEPEASIWPAYAGAAALLLGAAGVTGAAAWSIVALRWRREQDVPDQPGGTDAQPAEREEAAR